MKVLFLDVDGVLNSSDSTNFKNNLYPVDDWMCFLVGRIQLNTDCAIVVSSSWRHDPRGMETIRAKFNNVIDKTPYADGCRGDEIKAWLDAHPEVEKYAILDDDSDMLEEQLPNFFKTTFKEGLTEEIAKKVEEHLS